MSKPHPSPVAGTVLAPQPADAAGGNAAPLAFPVRVPFVEALGMTLHAMDAGQAELQLELSPDHHNAWDVAHGGVLMTMMDVAMAMAARSQLPAGTGVATIEMKTSFMRPAEGRLRALASVQHATSTLSFCEARVLDEHAKLCATATGTFKHLRALPARSGLKTQTASPPESPVP